MTMNNKPEVIELEEGWALVQKGIIKKLLAGGVPEQQSNLEEGIKLYTTIYSMCTQQAPHNYSQELYHRYKESCQEYISTMVLPALRESHDELMLREFVKQWDNYNILVRWLSHFLAYLDRYFIPVNRLPALEEVSLTCFRDQVYAEVKNNVKDAMITLVDRDRECGQIDHALLKNATGIIAMMGMGDMYAYESDFQLAMLTNAAAYYSRKAASWIKEDSCTDYMIKVEYCLKREKERVRFYLDASSESKLLETVQHELLAQYQNQLLEEEHSGCHALLRGAKVGDLSRMYRLFCMIPNGLQPFAAIFRQHVTDQGTTLVKKANDAASNKKAGKKERHGGQEQDFVENVIELHDKFLQYVKECYANHLLFHKALKEAFEVFCNKGVAGSTIVELLVTFCDDLLKGGSERLSKEAIEGTLDKVVKLLPYIHDKDLFAELYRKKLAHRLLLNNSANDGHEQSIMMKLKQQLGGQFTSKMEGMITDFALARENKMSFEKYLNGPNSTSNPRIDLTVTVLNTRYWPIQKPSELALPAEMVKCVEVFKEFYATKTKQRNLTWIYSLGTCSIIGTFDSKRIELIMTTYQAAVLLLFNGVNKLSYADIKAQLKLTDEDIVRLLYSLSCAKYKILNKDPSTMTVTSVDSFSFNSKFSDKMRSIDISLPPLDEKEKVMEDVHKDRRYEVDASIVRILKSRKILHYKKLVTECLEQLGQMFKPDVKIIKQRIEDLINREYLERDKDNPNIFRYLA